jgi:hypothetical protein
MKKLNYANNMIEQALKAEKWLEVMPERIHKANCYISDNNLSVKITLIHGDIFITHDKSIPKEHLEKIKSILK